MADTGGLGEDALRTWCHRADITPNKAEEDRFGWDFVLQWLPAGTTDDLRRDSAPGPKQAHVQVKTTKGTEWPRVRVSKLEALVKENAPAFILVVRLGAADQPTSAFLVEVAEDVTHAVLKLLREKPKWENRKREPKLQIRAAWAKQLPELAGVALRKLLDSAIGDDPLKYLNTKKQWRSSVGFEKRPFSFTIRHTGGSENEIVDAVVEFAIGLRDRLPVNITNFQETRFGLSRPVLEKLGPEGEALLELPELPGLNAEACLETASGALRTSISGLLHHPLAMFPGLPQDRLRLRFVGGAIDLLLGPSGNAVLLRFEHLRGKSFLVKDFLALGRWLRVLLPNEPAKSVAKLTISASGTQRVMELPLDGLRFAGPESNLDRVRDTLADVQRLVDEFGLDDSQKVDLDTLLKRSATFRSCVKLLDRHIDDGASITAEGNWDVIPEQVGAPLLTWSRIGRQIFVVGAVAHGRTKVTDGGFEATGLHVDVVFTRLMGSADSESEAGRWRQELDAWMAMRGITPTCDDDDGDLLVPE
jgi:hypothetical protein